MGIEPNTIGLYCIDEARHRRSKMVHLGILQPRSRKASACARFSLGRTTATQKPMSEIWEKRPGHNGLANSPFHSLVFGINNLRSGELSYFGAKCPRSAAVVQLLCNRNPVCEGEEARIVL
jgi:hypothetical protein